MPFRWRLLLLAACHGCPEGPEAKECLRRELSGEARPRLRCRKLRKPPKDFDAFFSQVLSQGQPVILENASAIFGQEVQRWMNVSYFVEKFGQLRFRTSFFNAAKNRTGQGFRTSAGEGVDRFGLTPINGGKGLLFPHVGQMDLAGVLSNRDPARMMFVEEGKLFAEEEGRRYVNYPELLDHWTKPPFLGPLQPAEVNLWAGGVLADRPKESPLHHDPFENIMLQLAGRKTFIMVSAVDTPKLYPSLMQGFRAPAPEDLHTQVKAVDAEDLMDNFSPVDPLRPDFKRFPDFKKVNPLTCTLKAGEAGAVLGLGRL
ncbi:unnamed protein product [Effrenium voratum]|nr:unnamed protein product [Effrenium voratum]